eukprot:g30216.t1
MLRCLAGLCCGSGPDEAVCGPLIRVKRVFFSDHQVEQHVTRPVVKPIRPLDRKELEVQAQSLDELANYGLQLAPPGDCESSDQCSFNFMATIYIHKRST